MTDKVLRTGHLFMEGGSIRSWGSKTPVRTVYPTFSETKALYALGEKRYDVFILKKVDQHRRFHLVQGDKEVRYASLLCRDGDVVVTDGYEAEDIVNYTDDREAATAALLHHGYIQYDTDTSNWGTDEDKNAFDILRFKRYVA